MPSDQTDADLRQAVDERLAARLEDARRRREKTEQDRAAKLARRTAGLRKRHARKLARLTPSSTASRDHDPQTECPDEHTESPRSSSEGGAHERALNRPAAVGSSSAGGAETRPVQRDETASSPTRGSHPQDDNQTPKVTTDGN